MKTVKVRGTDAEITRLLAEKVMGWPVSRTREEAIAHGQAGSGQICEFDGGAVRFAAAPGFGRDGWLARWRPLERIDHAWQVRDRLAEWGYVGIEHRQNGSECVVFTPGMNAPSYSRSVVHFEQSAPRAICLAALRAVGQDVEEG